jgi:hypothetical protein
VLLPDRGALAVPIDCTSLAIDPSTVPLDAYPHATLDAGDSVLFTSGGNPVTDLRIAPPLTISAGEAYSCGTGLDYFADETGGDVTATFNRRGPYYVRATRVSGPIEHLIVDVDVRNHGECKDGPKKEVDCGNPDVAVVSSTLGFAHNWGAAGAEVDDIDDAVTAVCDAFTNNGNMPVDVVIDAHGCGGSFSLGTEEVDIDNVDELCEPLQGKVSSLTIFACSVANGQAGKDLIDALSTCLGIPVLAYTGNNSDTEPGSGDVKWYTAGEAYSGEVFVVPVLAGPGGVVLVLLLATVFVRTFRRRARHHASWG